jgi:hypothetical protein
MNKRIPVRQAQLRTAVPWVSTALECEFTCVEDI